MHGGGSNILLQTPLRLIRFSFFHSQTENLTLTYKKRGRAFFMRGSKEGHQARPLCAEGKYFQKYLSVTTALSIPKLHRSHSRLKSAGG